MSKDTNKEEANKEEANKAVVLLSGGIDSAVVLALALHAGKECHALSFDYGQRHASELKSAQAIAKHYNIPHKTISIAPGTFENTSLVLQGRAEQGGAEQGGTVPKNKEASMGGFNNIPSTYVPARNTLFLAYAIGQAEILGAHEIHFGANALDNDAYPDCRREFFDAMQKVIDVATKQAVTERAPRLLTPIIAWDKQRIIAEGTRLNAPLHLTMSCYDPAAYPIHCGSCLACQLRKQGFAFAFLPDPTRYSS